MEYYRENLDLVQEFPSWEEHLEGLKIKLRELKNCKRLSFQQHSDNFDLKVLMHIIQYLQTEGLAGKFEIYEGEDNDRLFDHYGYIITVRTFYGTPKTRVYSTYGTTGKHLNEVVIRATNNIVKSYINAYWRDYQTLENGEILNKIKKTQIKYMLFVHKLYVSGRTEEEPFDALLCVRGNKSLGPGSRMATINLVVGSSQYVYKGPIYNIHILKDGEDELLQYLSSLIVAMKKAIRYLDR